MRMENKERKSGVEIRKINKFIAILIMLAGF